MAVRNWKIRILVTSVIAILVCFWIQLGRWRAEGVFALNMGNSASKAEAQREADLQNMRMATWFRMSAQAMKFISVAPKYTVGDSIYKNLVLFLVVQQIYQDSLEMVEGAGEKNFLPDSLVWPTYTCKVVKWHVYQVKAVACNPRFIINGGKDTVRIQAPSPILKSKALSNLHQT